MQKYEYFHGFDISLKVNNFTRMFMKKIMQKAFICKLLFRLART